MPNRNFSTSSYRYGFNGEELDPEGMGGGGSTYDYGFRIYNPNLGRFLSVDPLSEDYPWYTPYQFAGNKPIEAIDLDGLEEYFIIQKNLPNDNYERTYFRNKGHEGEGTFQFKDATGNATVGEIQKLTEENYSDLTILKRQLGDWQVKAALYTLKPLLTTPKENELK